MFNIDTLSNICKFSTFKDQLNVRCTCKFINNNITYHNYKYSNLLNKIGKIIAECGRELYVKYPEEISIREKCQIYIDDNSFSMVDHKFLSNKYSDLTETRDYFKSEYLLESCNKFIILSNYYTFKELMNNIDLIMIMRLLLYLLQLKFDVNFYNNHYYNTDIKIMKKYDLCNYHNRNLNHQHKLMKCIELTFGDNWENDIKDIICCDTKLTYTLKQLKINITKLSNMGNKIIKNCKDLKRKIERCEKFY
jgi:hypothetical protein